MKPLSLLPIAGALILFGCAFFGIWTAPGLEKLPSYQDLVHKSSPSSLEEVGEIAGVFAVSGDQDYRPEGVRFGSGDRQSIALAAPDPAMLERSAKAAARKAPVQHRKQLPTPKPSPDPFAKHRIKPYRATTSGWQR